MQNKTIPKLKMSSPLTLMLLIALVIGMAVISNLLEESSGKVKEPDVAEEIAPHVVFAVGPLEVTSTVVTSNPSSTKVLPTVRAASLKSLLGVMSRMCGLPALVGAAVRRTSTPFVSAVSSRSSNIKNFGLPIKLR